MIRPPDLGTSRRMPGREGVPEMRLPKHSSGRDRRTWTGCAFRQGTLVWTGFSLLLLVGCGFSQFPDSASGPGEGTPSVDPTFCADALSPGIGPSLRETDPRAPPLDDIASRNGSSPLSGFLDVIFWHLTARGDHLAESTMKLELRVRRRPRPNVHGSHQAIGNTFGHGE